jgi:serine/threonine protein kinase
VATRRDPATLNGTRLGSCVLEAPLGTGGMGAVYLARQERPHRKVAVKVLHQQLTSDPEAWRVFLQRFRREADATAALDHANIVPIYEFGEQQGVAYLVMPYLSDGSLAQVLDREGSLPLTRAVRYVEQIAAALDLAHRQGIVHRDVKPSNLLLHPDGRLMLADFGIARPLGGPDLIGPAPGDEHEDMKLTRAGATMGTPEYMAPEQARGEQAGPPSDIYALGIVAYEMLSGEPPFTAPNAEAVLGRQVNDPLPSLRDDRPDVPATVQEVLAWALAKNASDRPRTAGAFARALREAAQGGRTLAAASKTRIPRASWDETPIGSTPVGRGLGGATGAGLLALSDPDDRTVGSPIWRGDAGEGGPPTPAWPVPGGGGPGGRRGGPLGPLLVVLGGAVVAVIGIALVLSVVSQASSPFFSTQAAGANGTTQPAATQLPTATPKPTATPFQGDWLAVSDSSITLGCKGNRKSAVIKLVNRGPEPVSWQADIQSSGGGFGGGISIDPTSGTLDSHESTQVSITNTSVFFGHQGVIYFTPQNGDAGDPAAVQFNANGCGP